MTFATRLVALSAVVLLAVGCGSAEFTPVSGTVTYDGKPLTNGFVSLIPDAGGESASGAIDSEGRFTISTVKPGDGARPGNYKVVITSYPPGMVMGDSKSKPAIPAKYFDGTKSGLTLTVEKKSSQTVEWNLPKE